MSKKVFIQEIYQAAKGEPFDRNAPTSAQIVLMKFLAENYFAYPLVRERFDDAFAELDDKMGGRIMSDSKQITLGLTLRQAHDVHYALLTCTERQREKGKQHERMEGKDENIITAFNDMAAAYRDTAKSLEGVMNDLEGLINQIAEGETKK